MSPEVAGSALFVDDGSADLIVIEDPADEEIVFVTADDSYDVIVEDTEGESVLLVEEPQNGVAFSDAPAEPVFIGAGDADLVVISEQGDTGPQGPQGPPGEAGTDGSLTLTFDAGETLSGHRVVRPAGDGTVIYASADDPVSQDGPYWLTNHAANLGDPVEVTILGEVVEASWAWTAPGVIFLGLNGLLTQTPPASDLSIQVAAATETDTLYFDPEASIDLA